MSSISNSMASSSLLSITSALTSQTDVANPMDKVMASMASLLGMSTSDLKTAQQSGQTLQDLAKAKGISSDTLTSTLATALQANAPADAPTGVDYTKMATDIASGKGPGGPGGVGGGHHHHRGGLNATDGSSTSSSNINDLLSSLGIDPSELSSLLTSAESSSSTSSSNTYSASTTPSTATGASSASATDSTSSDFLTQLKSLLSQYGSKGNLYDTTL